MPRYFFNVHIGGDALVDPEGQILRDADQAWEVAQAMARNLMSTEFEQPVNWATAHIEVKDDLDELPGPGDTVRHLGHDEPVLGRVFEEAVLGF